ncbi:drug/metabolite transporter (DMT)-like permease [Filimonas zeae]|uniref:Permease n=1 Tax=Filimonas zeae TaxID=1737353 RepID=A0A917J0R0_9BACT|nr:DMT family transporter [Filimonas zeae]MDR6340087.1 drug/metabolite transporter (DMT)-like permease [Filimonas zeae]GGH71073.1 permease [Filimonas zeae]
MKKLKGIVYIAVGAASYGILATFVKVAGKEGYTTALITFAQYITGFVVLALADTLRKKQLPASATPPGKNETWKLIAGGTCLGLTSTFYYLSVQYLPVSVSIILLMQTVWIGILADCIRSRQLPRAGQLAVIAIVLTGTALATGLTHAEAQWNLKGCVYGLLAAVCYTGSMYAANHIAPQQPLFYRSKLLVLGGMLAVIAFWNIHIIQEFQAGVFTWGLLLGLFGTILPPLLFSKGFPSVGLGLGSILAAIEIPISIATAHWVLHEAVSGLQIVGCIIILAGIAAQHLRIPALYRKH